MTNHYRLVILRLQRDHQPGAAVVCPDARYASICWRGYDRLDRLHATPAQWLGILEQFASIAVNQPLDKRSPLARAVGSDDGVKCSVAEALSIETAPDNVAFSLDEVLAEASPPPPDVPWVGHPTTRTDH